MACKNRETLLAQRKDVFGHHFPEIGQDRRFGGQIMQKSVQGLGRPFNLQLDMAGGIENIATEIVLDCQSVDKGAEADSLHCSGNPDFLSGDNYKLFPLLSVSTNSKRNNNVSLPISPVKTPSFLEK